jgi:cytochrome P450
MIEDSDQIRSGDQSQQAQQAQQELIKLAPYLPEFLTQEFHEDPYPFYRRWREQDPIYWGASQGEGIPGFWFLTGFKDVVSVLRDPRFGRELHRVLPLSAFAPLTEEQKPFIYMVGQWMLVRDPPDHTRLRALVNRAFTPRVVQQLRPKIEKIADTLLADQAQAGSMDLIADFALPLPVIVIAEMLGIRREDRTLLKEWSTEILGALDLCPEPGICERASKVTLEFTEYLGKLVAERRKKPEDDLISALIAAEEAGDKLSEEELYATAILLLFAGHETTTNLIGNGMLALLRHPDQLKRLKDNPGLIQTAVEELLRYDSPVQITLRVAFEDVEMDGKIIRKGTQVGICIGAANRDPAQFLQPDCLDLTRADNRHIAFGMGMHFCIGAALARLEGQIAIDALLKKFPDLQLQSCGPVWRNTIALRGLAKLPVSL